MVDLWEDHADDVGHHEATKGTTTHCHGAADADEGKLRAASSEEFCAAGLPDDAVKTSAGAAVPPDSGGQRSVNSVVNKLRQVFVTKHKRW